MNQQENEPLQLSGLQHFRFCRRQWALIHIENQWAENFRTVDGSLMHEHAHDTGFPESRGDRLTVRGLAIHSAALGVTGQCDVVEFRRAVDGIPLRTKEGLWQPYPVEYKRGKPKENDADKLQLRWAQYRIADDPLQSSQISRIWKTPPKRNDCGKLQSNALIMASVCKIPCLNAC